MFLKTEKKSVELRPTTKKIVRMTKERKAKNLNEYFFNVVNDCDVEGLASIILSFAEKENGSSAFNSLSEVYDFIDDLRSEQDKSYEDLMKELGEMINDMGFFRKKMTKGELKEMMENPIAGIDMKTVISNSTEKAISEVVSEEFRGYKA